MFLNPKLTNLCLRRQGLTLRVPVQASVRCAGLKSAARYAPHQTGEQSHWQNQFPLFVKTH